jgi:hypothetical protein
MQLHKENPSRLLQMREAAFESASIAIKDAKARHAAARQHRAISRLTVGPSLYAQAIILPLVFCGLLLLAEPLLMAFWRDCILFWLARLDIPLEVHRQSSTIGALRFDWANPMHESAMPTFAMKVSCALLTFGVLALTTGMNNSKLPLKYLLRIICAVQLISLGFFWYVPSQFPYTIPDHMRDIISMGYMMLLAIPVLLAIGYYLLHRALHIKILHTAGILAYFIVMVPHKVVLHTLILYKMSLLYMPVLYVCLGAVFDVLLFVALSSWAVSTLPEQATQ